MWALGAHSRWELGECAVRHVAERIAGRRPPRFGRRHRRDQVRPNMPRRHGTRDTLTSSADMSVRLRLTRIGSRKNPVWRVVVADQRSKRDGRVIETVGHYNAQTNPSTIVLNEERIRDWLARGAQPSQTVRKLLRTQGIH